MENKKEICPICNKEAPILGIHYCPPMFVEMDCDSRISANVKEMSDEVIDKIIGRINERKTVSVSDAIVQKNIELTRVNTDLLEMIKQARTFIDWIIDEYSDDMAGEDVSDLVMWNTRYNELLK